MTAPEMLPCPFCGGEADVSHDHTVEENHAYGCRKCGVWFDTFNSDDAIAAWNRRHEAAVAAARKEALAVLRDAGDDVVRASNTLMLMLVGEMAMTKPALEAAIRRTLDARNAWDNVFKDASK